MGRLCWFENGGCDHKSIFKAESRHTAGMNKPWRTFCRPVTNVAEHYECRDTMLMSETDLSKCNKCYKTGTGAVSRYKLSRRQ
jgi:hypothetical protein